MKMSACGRPHRSIIMDMQFINCFRVLFLFQSSSHVPSCRSNLWRMWLISFVECFVVTLLFLAAASSSSGDSYYTLLGLKKTSTLKEVKAAYRKKAKETHPDKNRNSDSEEAAKKFREVAEAYEVLSDSNARNEYDRTGVKQADKNQQNHNNNNNQRNQGQQPFWDFFGRRNHHPQHDPLQHHLYRRHDIRLQVHAAQRRVLTVTSLDHFKALTLDEDSGLFDRYALLAIYNSNTKGCEKALNEFAMFPWPFAGFTRDGGDTSMWWEETMQAFKVDLAPGNNAGSDSVREIQEYFGVDSEHTCPSVVLFKRGKEILDFEIWDKSHSQEFRAFVWDRLTMTVSFFNKTPWKLKQFFLNGNRGIQKESIPPNEGYKVNTYLSHAFMFVADHVTGSRLNNESAVFYYTSRIQDDRQVIDIEPRCFDLHTDCLRWKQEGFCSQYSRASHLKPATFEWVTDNCPVSCQNKCGDVSSA